MWHCSASMLLQQHPGKIYGSATALGSAVHCSIASFIDTSLEQASPWACLDTCASGFSPVRLQLSCAQKSLLWVWQTLLSQGHLTKSLGSLLNVPYFIHFSLQSTLKVWIAGRPDDPIPSCPWPCFFQCEPALMTHLLIYQDSNVLLQLPSLTAPSTYGDAHKGRDLSWLLTWCCLLLAVLLGTRRFHQNDWDGEQIFFFNFHTHDINRRIIPEVSCV